MAFCNQIRIAHFYICRFNKIVFIRSIALNYLNVDDEHENDKINTIERFLSKTERSMHFDTVIGKLYALCIE